MPLTAAISGLTNILINNATALPAAGQTIEAISGIGIKLLSDYSITPEPQPTIETLTQEIKDSIDSPQQQTDIKPPQESITKTSATIPTPKRETEPDATTPPTGGVKNDETLEKPVKTDIIEPADT